MKNILHDQPEYAEGVCLLTPIDAALGHRQEAIAGRRAADLLLSKRCYDGPGVIVKPRDHLHLGWREKDLAIKPLDEDATALRTYFLRSTAFTSVGGILWAMILGSKRLWRNRRSRSH